MFIDHVGEVGFSGERGRGRRTVIHSPEWRCSGSGPGGMTLIGPHPGSTFDAPSSPG